MRHIWFGLLTVTAGLTAHALGCGDTPEQQTGSTSSSTSSTTTTTTTTTTTATTTTTTTATTGTTTGAGGMGGAPACSAAIDCGNDGPCVTFTCDQGSCVTTFKPLNFPLPDAIVPDCKQKICDGAGNETSINIDEDIPSDGNDCTVDSCLAGAPKSVPSAAGAACGVNGDKLCDGQGACVECLAAGNCASGICQANTCVPAMCVDAVKNGSETDVDCGGMQCNPCADGKACLVAGDCAGAVCKTNVCQVPTCVDAAKNGAETDVDCGGPVCTACGDAKKCMTGADCASKVCLGNPSTCQAATCVDGVKNGGESDLDCGAVCPTKCAIGKACGVAGDCASGACNAVTKTCDPSCTDGLKNGTETDVDCGGSCATTCALGKSCGVAGDCATGICTQNVCAQINGCDPTTAEDHTASMADVTVDFGGAVGFAYAPKCIKVKNGTKVVFNGSFMGHPLVAGEIKGFMSLPAAMGTTPLPISPGLSTGVTASFTMTPAGTYPYYCLFHGTGGMDGAIFVVP